ncbi:alkaline phosphatase, partial [Chloroflexota bacterium]
TYYGAIGVDINKDSVKHILERAEELGKATGVVTSVPLSHSTPAGFVAHNKKNTYYEAIAREMILDSATDVIMGCGNPWYNNNGELLTESRSYQYVGGQEVWDSLVAGIAGGDADADGDNDPWVLIQTRTEFQNLATGLTPDRVIGVPLVNTTLQQRRDGDRNVNPYVIPLTATVPTLEEMTGAALNILDNDPDGLFLVIEGGAVDWTSHPNQSGRMIEELIDFNRAVEGVVEWVKHNSNWGETLIIVTGDHECGYLWGSGSNPTWEPIGNNGRRNLPSMAWYSDDHTNSLIPFFAKGATSRFFKDYADEYDYLRGHYIDNTEIAKVVFMCLNADSGENIWHRAVSGRLYSNARHQWGTGWR